MTKPYVLQEIDNLKTSVEDVRKAKNIGIEDTAGVFTSENVEDALKEIKDLIGDGLDVEVTASEVTTESGSNVQDEIDSLKLSVSSGKTNIRNALTDKGLTVADADGDGISTHAELVSSINTPDLVRTNSADATAGQIRNGKTAFVNGSKITGTLPVRSTGTETITPGISNIVRQAGIYDGDITILGDPDLVSANIKAGVTIFGITGEADISDTGDATADANEILLGETAYVNGVKITGTMANKTATIALASWNNDTASTQFSVVIPNSGYYRSGDWALQIADSDLISANIKSGISIFGVSGKASVVDTADANGESWAILSGYTGYVNGSKVVGVMPDNGPGTTITPGINNIVLADGYWDSTNVIMGDPDLVSANIKAGVSIFGVTGNSNVVDTSPGTAIADDILSTKIAFVDGAQITGTMPNQTGEYSAVDYYWWEPDKNLYFKVPKGYYPGGTTGNWTNGGNIYVNEPDLISANIKAGISIFGITGKASVVETSDATVSSNFILSGYTAYVNGSKITGTMANQTGTNITSTDNYTAGGNTLYLKMPQGYYSPASDSLNPSQIGGWLTISDPDFVSANIKAGTNIFGISGKTEVVDTTESTAPATAGYILNGRIGFVNGIKHTGTMPNHGTLTYMPSTVTQTIPAGYSDGGTIAGDADLISANIKAGINIFGVSGKSSVVDTADGTVIAGEMISGKTAYVNGSKVTGTIPDRGFGRVITPGVSPQTIAYGYWATLNTVEGDSDLIASNIKEGVSIFGVTGNAYTLYSGKVVPLSKFKDAPLITQYVTGAGTTSVESYIAHIDGWMMYRRDGNYFEKIHPDLNRPRSSYYRTDVYCIFILSDGKFAILDIAGYLTRATNPNTLVDGQMVILGSPSNYFYHYELNGYLFFINATMTYYKIRLSDWTIVSQGPISGYTATSTTTHYSGANFEVHNNEVYIKYGNSTGKIAKFTQADPPIMTEYGNTFNGQFLAINKNRNELYTMNTDTSYIEVYNLNDLSTKARQFYIKYKDGTGVTQTVTSYSGITGFKTLENTDTLLVDLSVQGLLVEISLIDGYWVRQHNRGDISYQVGAFIRTRQNKDQYWLWLNGKAATLASASLEVF